MAKADKGLHCVLVARGHAGRRFKPCKSPKRYRRLKSGRYTFKVRAYNAAGKEKTPAKRQFRIRP